MKTITTILLCATASSLHAQSLPPVPVPPENPITEAKRALGKILFWDTQLSSDNTTACGTCHQSSSAGADPRFGYNPGADGIQWNSDDIIDSPGVVDSDSNGMYVPNATFDLLTQVTARAANSYGMIQYAPELFWDGRASSTFTDPETGAVLIASGGALESQAVEPLMGSEEMAHQNRDWNSLNTKLVTAKPMALATNLPSDMAQALAIHSTYPELFTEAFGDATINAGRIGMAIATYERTLVADDTPYDRTQNGQAGGLTPDQEQGLQMFSSPMMLCSECHTPPMFTDFTYRNVGLRPIAEDAGRFGVTKDINDRGRFKVPSLRNVGLKSTFMHNGRLLSLDNVLDFYGGNTTQFPENQDPIIGQIFLPPMAIVPIKDFLANGLTDARVRDELYPFDRPTLINELAQNPLPVGTGTAGSGGFIPAVIAPSATPNIGNTDFRFGIKNALGQAQASIVLYRTQADAEAMGMPVVTLGPITLAGKGQGRGYGTIHWPIEANSTLLADSLYAQWIVQDSNGSNGEARSELVEVSFYEVDPTSCNCPGDVTCDSIVGVSDLLAMIDSWGECDFCGTDLNNDGAVNVLDLLSLIDNWGGC